MGCCLAGHGKGHTGFIPPLRTPGYIPPLYPPLPDPEEVQPTWPQAVEGGLLVRQALAVTHVRHLAAPLTRQQHIVGLQVPVHDAPLMQRQEALPYVLCHLQVQQRNMGS